MLVQEGIYDDFLAAFTEAVRGLKVADGFTRRRERRPAHRRARGREGRAPRRRRASSAAPSSSSEASDRGPVLPAVGARRRDGRDGDELRGDVRPGRGDRALLHRGRGGTDRQRHAVRARRVLLLAGPRPRAPRRRGARVRDPRHQHGLISTEVAPFGGVKESGIGARAPRTGSTSGSSSSTGRSAASRDRRAARLPRLHGEAPGARAALRDGGHPDPAGDPRQPRRRVHDRVGALSTYTTMWRYDSFAEREERRARLAGRRALEGVPREGAAAHAHAAEPDPRSDPVLAAA